MGPSESRSCPSPLMPSLRESGLTRTTGPPRFLTSLSVRAAPKHPGRSADDVCSLRTSAVAGRPVLGRKATFELCFRGRIGFAYAAARTFARRGFDGTLTSDAARSATCRMSNLHGELLTFHETGQALPGAPRVKGSSSRGESRGCRRGCRGSARSGTQPARRRRCCSRSRRG